MNSILKKLKIGQKLNLLGYVGVFGLVISSISIWFLLNNLHSLSDNMQNYASIKARAGNIRVAYNAMRGDLLLMFILDPTIPEQVERSNKTFEHYNKMLQLLKDEQKALTEEAQKDAELIPLANNLSKSIEEYNNFMAINSKKIKEVLLTDSVAMAECRDVLFNKFDPIFTKLLNDRDALFKVLNEKSEKSNADFISANKTANWLILSITVLVIIVVSIFSKIIGSNISNRLTYVSETLNQVSSGDLPPIKVFDDKDEIATMSHSFTNLVDELNKLKLFTVAVGNGNYETDIEVFNNKGEISNALSSMKENLKIASDLKAIQNYTSEGLAKFSNILRNDQDEHYYDNILSNLVKYVHANQGGLFIANEENGKTVLNRVATYAYDRKKFISKTIDLGEGLAGQCALEGATIHLTEIPQTYLEITSGLGTANPSAVIIVPLKINEQIMGVIELASFSDFETYEIEFVEKVSESIASSIVSSKTNQRTKELLAISQQQTEEMRAQEEEMRQNMEEMQATSEEAERKAMNYEATIQSLKDAIAAFSTASNN